MPRDGAGNYTLPPGNPVFPGTVIEANWANPTMSDIAAALTDSLSRTGSGGMFVPFLNADGVVGAPGMSWINEPSSGWYRAALNDFWYSVGNENIFRITKTGIELAAGKTTTGIVSFMNVQDALPAGMKQGQQWWESDTAGFYFRYVNPDLTETLVSLGATGGDFIPNGLRAVPNGIATLNAAGLLLEAQRPQSIKVVTFLAAGAYAYNKPADMVAALVIVIGGGASGATTQGAAGQTSMGAGGNAGGVAVSYLLTAAIPATVNGVIGAAGVATAGEATGGAGGATTFPATVTMTGAGGLGGFFSGVGTSTDPAAAFPNVAAASAGGNIVNVNTGMADVAVRRIATAGRGGNGGNNLFGAGGAGANSGGGGIAGTGIGAGGGGSCSDSATIRLGGNGTAGGVIVLEIY